MTEPPIRRPRRTVGDQLDDRLAAAEIARPGIRFDASRDGREAFGARLARREAGGREAHPEDADDRGADDPGEALARAGGIGPRDAARFIGGSAERNLGGAAGDDVLDFGAIPGGEDAAQIRLHALVGPDCAGASELDARIRGELDVWLEAGGDHDHVRARDRRRTCTAAPRCSSTPCSSSCLRTAVGERRIVAQEGVRGALVHA